MRDTLKNAAPFAAILLAAGLTLTGCAEPEQEFEPTLRPVRYVVATTSNDVAPDVIAGVARAGIDSNLSFRVNGTLIAVPVEVGDRIRRGQVLARVDPTDYELSFEEAKAAVAMGEASLRQAEADYERIRGLYENNNAAKSDLDAARAGAEGARAQVDASRKQMQLASQQINYTRLVAPVNGAVAAVNAEINETVSAGQSIVRVTSGGRPEIELAVSETLISSINKGMRAEVRFDALIGQAMPGVVTEVGVATAPGAATYPVTVQLDMDHPEVRSGMAAEVTLATQSSNAQERLTVPFVSVGEDDTSRFVYVVERTADQEGLVRRRNVQIGEIEPGRIEILEGVEPGDMIVTAGVRRLTDGMQVKIDKEGR